MISQKIPPDKIFPRRYMNFEQKYQKDPGMNRVKREKSQLRSSNFCVEDNGTLPKLLGYFCFELTFVALQIVKGSGAGRGRGWKRLK